ncbi:MAG: FtsB family cell division protein [Caulobacteraceae bacterium]
MLGRLSTYIPTAILAALIFYFGFNALTGDRGILTARARQATLAEDEAELKALQAERTDLEQRARLLSDADLSRDLLEERAHVVLGFADPRDYVIRTPPPAR